MNDVLKDAVDWAREFGIIILDPDGWRKHSPYGPLSTDTPITKEDFARRAAVSTVGPRKVLEPSSPKNECCGEPIGYHTWKCTRAKWVEKNGS